VFHTLRNRHPGDDRQEIDGRSGRPDRDVAKIDAGVIANVRDRSNKIQASEALKPTNRFGSRQGSIDHFVESRAKTEDFLESTPAFAIVRSKAPLEASGMNSSCALRAERAPHQSNQGGKG